MQVRLYVAATIFLLFNSCRKINYFPDKDACVEAPKLIAHRGGRNATYRENTLDGIRAALRHKDGIEVDVQISKDETVWLSHSEIVTGCGQTLRCFPETRDADIKAITTCNGMDISYTQLEDVYRFVRDSFPSAPICIDLKGWMPCSGNSLDIEGMMRREAKRVIELAEKYGLEKNTLIETEASSVLTYVRAINRNIPTYQTVHGDFERGMLICLNYGYTGMSFKTNIHETLDREKIDMLHRKGLKIMVWNLNNKDEAKIMSDIGVDYIQIDL